MSSTQTVEEKEIQNASALVEVGKLLAEQRDKLGMSLQECSDILKIPSPKLEALENGKSDTSVPELFLRGYIKSYSKLLQLSPEEILEYYERQQEVKPDIVETPQLTKSTSIGKWWLPYVIGLAVILLWFLLSDFLKSGESTSSLVESPIVEESPRNQVVESSAPQEAAEREDSTLSLEVLTVEVSDDDKDVVSEFKSQGDSDSVAVEVEEKIEILESAVDDASANAFETLEGASSGVENVQSAATTEDVNQPELGAGTDKLYFTFAEECWVEVIDADGQVIISSLRQANTDLSVVGKAPFSILFGNVNGTNLYYNDQSIPLIAGVDGRTARVKVGQ